MVAGFMAWTCWVARDAWRAPVEAGGDVVAGRPKAVDAGELRRSEVLVGGGADSVQTIVAVKTDEVSL